MAALRAAIVGLGNVGMLFDDDPKRRGTTWTHFSAYERLPDRYELVAVAEPDRDRLDRARKRRPSLATFASLQELLDTIEVDVVSLCTPVELHAAQLAICAGRTRAIVCEKPLAADADVVAACARAGTLLAVNYYKRFEPAVRAALEALPGEVVAAVARYTGSLDAVGSHAVDLLTFLLGPLEVSHVEAGSRVAATLRAADGAVATLLEAGEHADLLFELELIATGGRVRILDNCARYELELYEPSGRYSGYRELVATDAPPPPAGDPFVAHFQELADVLGGNGEGLTSDGVTALHTQRLLDAIRDRLPDL